MASKKSSGKGSKKKKQTSKRKPAAADVPGAEPIPGGEGPGAQPADFEASAMPTISLEDSEVTPGASGRPRKIRGDFPLPVTHAARDLADESLSLSGPVQAFLRANSDATGMSADDASLRPLQEVATPIGRVVRFQRLHEGIPVVDASVIVHVDEDSRVKQIDLGDTPQAVAPSRAAMADEGAGRTKKLTPKQALKVAQDSLGGQVTYRHKVDDPTQVYLPGSGGLRLAYLVVAPTREPEPHDWRIIVDAYTGEVLEKRDMIVFVNGAGLVFEPEPGRYREQQRPARPGRDGRCVRLRRHGPRHHRRAARQPHAARHHLLRRAAPPRRPLRQDAQLWRPEHRPADRGRS
jgi:hypothetical protein